MAPIMSTSTATRRASYGINLNNVASSSTAAFRDSAAAAPAIALEAAWTDSVSLRSPQLIEEAIACNHAGVSKGATRERYRTHLQHFDAYLTSVYGVRMVNAKRKHVSM